MSDKAKNALKTALKIGFAVLLITWMIRKGVLDFSIFAKIASPALIGFCALCVLAQIFFNNLRWMVLLRGQGFASTVRYTLQLSFIGMFFNFAVPGGVGGDVVKGYYLLQDFPRQKFTGAVSIIMDRAIGFFVMIATAFLALFFNWSAVSHSNELQSVALGVSGVFVFFLVFFSFALSRRLHRSRFTHLIFKTMPGGPKLRSLYDALHSYRKSPSALLSAILFSVLNQLLLVAVVWSIAEAMGESIPIAVYFFLVPVGTVVQALPLAPAGIGVGQAAFYFLFSLYLGKQSQVGPTAVTTIQILSFLWGLVGAFFYLRRRGAANAPVPSSEQAGTLS